MSMFKWSHHCGRVNLAEQNDGKAEVWLRRRIKQQ